MKIALFETDIIAGNLSIADMALESYFSDDTADLVLLPECFATGFAVDSSLIENEGESMCLRWLKDRAVRYSTAIYTSIPVECGSHNYNRGYFILPDGEIAAVYDKRHLFLGDEADMYTQGNRQIAVDYKEWRFALNICYDLRFPVWSRNASGFSYDIMLNVSNWPTSRMDVVDIVTRARAIENQCYMFFCNRIGKDHITTYSGGSVAVDPKGRFMGVWKDCAGTRVLTAEPDRLWLDSFRAYFPVLDDADNFEIE